MLHKEFFGDVKINMQRPRGDKTTYLKDWNFRYVEMNYESPMRYLMQSECLFKASESKLHRIFVPERAVMRSKKAKRAPKETMFWRTWM